MAKYFFASWTLRMMCVCRNSTTESVTRASIAPGQGANRRYSAAFFGKSRYLWSILLSLASFVATQVEITKGRIIFQEVVHCSAGGQSQSMVTQSFF